MGFGFKCFILMKLFPEIREREKERRNSNYYSVIPLPGFIYHSPNPPSPSHFSASVLKKNDPVVSHEKLSSAIVFL